MNDVETHEGSWHCGVQPFGNGRMPDRAATVAINIRALTAIEPWAWAAKRVDGRRF